MDKHSPSISSAAAAEERLEPAEETCFADTPTMSKPSHTHRPVHAQRVQNLHANGVTLHVVRDGPPTAEPLLLIPGFAMQLTDWPRGLIDQLVEAGFHVIRFDLRDMGLSESMDSHGQAGLVQAVLWRTFGASAMVPYTLADLADDAAALLTALEVPSAHVCGVSMGGMVAQHLVARHPQRVRSLTLMMTTTGSPWVPRASPLLLSRLQMEPPSWNQSEALVQHFVNLYSAIGSPGFPEPTHELRERVEAGLKRSYRPQALSRQMAAVVSDGDCTPLLRTIHVPTVVIHGSDDVMVPVGAGRDLARRIPGAIYDEIPGLGHDFPRALWPRFVRNIAQVARQARQRPASP
ncbi:alpha/beta hydrolase (plasmid) [Vitreoscilla filiformis]|jgi:pimeloyl-ACP methyl ester carboxylesterase|uniref:Alpha/beta hydrolase n=1 Tax=Vitreoscilla filiformis TaxID=63 RepID=A0A221KJP4_VITFI|nr:alpha/beta fold hydrolase [Vitreoscilla filiformis]ASM79238.1 alpha/beta hydrolase [Vitreoscilla filiformis]